jgi:menaquinone-dependent protoporphyrinogen IX oxidase
MAEVLIVYATELGHTRRIAERVAMEVRSAGHRPTVASTEAAPPPGSFDAVIVGAAVRASAFIPPIERYTRKHAAPMAHRPSGLFSVCAPDDHDDRACRDALDTYVRTLQHDTGWYPDVIASFAGIRPYTHIGIAHSVLASESQAMDDSEAGATDWDAVSGFVEAFLHHLNRAQGVPSVSSARPAST